MLPCRGDRLWVDPRDLRAALSRIAASRPFDTSPKLTSFLRFVVESTLAGGGARLKGYTIGVEALGRNASFDPQTDPIVRVEAGRLRAALARYYAGAGARDRIVIELPRGGYRPNFRRVRRFSAAAIWRRAFGALQWLLAAKGEWLLPPPPPTQRAHSDGRQAGKIQQAEGAAAARARRPRPG